MHGAAGRVGTAMLELARVAGLRVFGTASARDREKVEQLGAVAIDYRHEDFVARIREMTDAGVDVVSDSLGGPISLRSFRVLRPGGRLVVFGRYDTLRDGHKDWPAVFKWYGSVAPCFSWALCLLAGRWSGIRSRSSARPRNSEMAPWVESRAIRSGSRRTSTRWSICCVAARSIPWSPSAYR